MFALSSNTIGDSPQKMPMKQMEYGRADLLAGLTLSVSGIICMMMRPST